MNAGRSTASLKRYGTSFHFASRFLSSDQADRAARLYALCREIDDIADRADDLNHARLRLQSIRDELAGKTALDPIAKTVVSFSPKVSTEVLKELVEGVMLDPLPVLIRAQDELLKYCYQVAGTVGLQMCDIYEVTNVSARYHAIDLGIAMQLTNICRDVCEDAQRGRRYLPSDLVGDIAPENVLSPSKEQAQVIRQALKHLLEEAEIRYQSGIAGLCFLPLQSRTAILIAALSYREIGVKIAVRDFDVWHGRVYTRLIRKGLLAIKAISTILFCKRLRKYQGFHNSALHHSLGKNPSVHSEC